MGQEYMKREHNPNKRHVATYRAVAERALGRPLPLGAIVHHVDENPLNNRNDNLVICPDRAYHKALHERLAAMKACGHSDWWKCFVCKAWGEPGTVHRSGRSKYHPACVAQRIRERAGKADVPSRNVLKRSDIPTLRRLRAEGLSYAAIGKQYGVFPAAIYRAIRRADKRETEGAK